jgi:hypothetical protein
MDGHERKTRVEEKLIEANRKKRFCFGGCLIWAAVINWRGAPTEGGNIDSEVGKLSNQWPSCRRAKYIFSPQTLFLCLLAPCLRQLNPICLSWPCSFWFNFWHKHKQIT